jgi:hypothetical protein
VARRLQRVVGMNTNQFRIVSWLAFVPTTVVINGTFLAAADLAYAMFLDSGADAGQVFRGDELVVDYTRQAV